MQENNTEQIQPFIYPKYIILFSRIVSIVFHPLFIGVYLSAFLFFIHPTYFLGFTDKAKLLKLLTIINNNVFFPLLVVALLRGLGFSKSVQLKEQKERIIPYIAAITFYFWTYYVFRSQPENPTILVLMCRGMFMASSIALIANNYFKISMHAIACGGMLGLFILTIQDGTLSSGIPMMLSFFITGLVLTARKISSDHTWFDLLSGLIVGLLSQLTGLWF
jgi:hypothetical protein